MTFFERSNLVNWWKYSLLEVSEAVTKFVLSVHSVYLLENENIVEPEDISMARSIKLWKYISWKENVIKMEILKSIVSKMPIMKIPFRWSGMGARMKSSEAMLKLVKGMMNVQDAREVTVKVKSGYVVQYPINGNMKTVFYE